MVVLLSEAINRYAGGREHGVIVSEESLIFACDRCGQSTTARGANVTHPGADVIYSCPSDNATLAEVEAQGTYTFHEGCLTIKIAGEEITWRDFVGSIDELAE